MILIFIFVNYNLQGPTENRQGEWVPWINIIIIIIINYLRNLWTFFPNFVAFFVFSGTASSCILKISDSETLAKHEFTPAILFLFGLRIIHSVGDE